MKTITYNGVVYTQISENADRNKFINGTTFINAWESGVVEVLRFLWLQYSNHLELSVNKVALTSSEIKSMFIAGMKQNRDVYKALLEELYTMDVCPKCGDVHELYEVEFSQIPYNELCESCLAEEMRNHGIGECERCETMAELYDPTDEGLSSRLGLLCEDCLVLVKEELREGA